jgi:hypothetical protein
MGKGEFQKKDSKGKAPKMSKDEKRAAKRAKKAA